MPKPHSNMGRNKNWDRNYHSEHDSRGENVRRVSFKPGSNKIKKNRNFEMALKHLNDGDVDMSGNSAGRNPSHRNNFRGRGRRDGRVNSPVPRQNYPARKLLPGNSSWYQVTIPYGQKHDKTTILNVLLKATAPDIFVPHFYNIVGNAAIFYVDDFDMAEKLHYLDKKITMTDGFRLLVKVKSGTPSVAIDENFLEKMKQAMAGRYNAANKALDLTKFHADPALADVFCALFRPSIFLAAINIISENIPDLVALNLNDNKIQVLDHLKILHEKLPNLKILYLAKNRIPHINALESIKGLGLLEICLEGNPMLERYKEKEVFARDVRKKFPKLVKLDGNDLPPQIGFDIATEGSLPPSAASFLCNAEGQTIVRQFLEQYFALYDKESRQPLLDAYHEQALFSLTASYSCGQQPTNSTNRLNHYITSSRNLLRLNDRDTRKRNLKIGRLQVVSFLNDLPKTQHDPMSFTVDLTIFTPVLIMLTITGVFKEFSNQLNSNKSSQPVIRSFHKTMVIVPQNGGFCIKNDMLHITNATLDQIDDSFKTPMPTTSGMSNPPPPYVAPVAPVSVPGVISEDQHQQLVQQLALQTNMNLHWSKCCLEQSQWIYQRALEMFTSLHSSGGIPPEAFVK